MQYREGILSEDDPLYELLSQAFQSRIRGYWVRRAWQTLRESAHRQVIVKLVRGQLAIGSIAATFQIPAVHIQRDPRAVVASILRSGWGKGWLEEISLRDQLLLPEDGRTAFFGRFENAIRTYDSQGPVERIAAYWGFTEIFVLSQRRKLSQHVTAIAYETLRQDVETSFQSLLETIERQPVADIRDLLRHIDSPSATAGPRRGLTPFSERVSGWQRELSPETTSAIERVVADLGLEELLFDHFT